MSSVTITHSERFALPMPYVIAINGRNVGVMRSRRCVVNNIPEGSYDITVKCGMFFKGREFTLSGSQRIEVGREENCAIRFRNREVVWNILFDIDLLLWIAGFFITLPHPWHLVYKIISNGFFVIWLIRLYMIRDRYFVIS